MSSAHDDSPGAANDLPNDSSDEWYKSLHWSTDPAAPDDNEWVFSEADEGELERGRLEAALQETRARTAAAKRLRVERVVKMRQALHAEVLDLQRQLADVETHHADELVRIRTEAKAQAQQIIDDARLKVTAKVGGIDVG